MIRGLTITFISASSIWTLGDSALPGPDEPLTISASFPTTSPAQTISWIQVSFFPNRITDREMFNLCIRGYSTDTKRPNHPQQGGRGGLSLGTAGAMVGRGKGGNWISSINLWLEIMLEHRRYFLPQVLPAPSGCPASGALDFLLTQAIALQFSSFAPPPPQPPGTQSPILILCRTGFALTFKGPPTSIQQNGLLFRVTQSSPLGGKTLLAERTTPFRSIPSTAAFCWGHRAWCAAVITSLSHPAQKREQIWAPCLSQSHL